MKFAIRRLESFEFLFKRLVRKAVKLGLAAPTFRVIGERAESATVYEVCEGQKTEVGTEMVIVNDIEIDGLDPVKLAGWQFRARLETVKGSDNLVFGLPGVEIPASFSKSGCKCEHCNVNRYRVNTYVVQHSESGEWKQVGSTCLQDFMGGDSAAAIVALFEFYGDIIHDLDALSRAEQFGWQGGNAAHGLADVIAKSLAVQREHGWVSKSKAWDCPNLTSTAVRVKTGKKGECVTTPADYTKAEEIISFFASIAEADIEPADSLTRNARIICNAGFCSDKSFGLACALPVCYSVALSKVGREERKALQRERSQHFGTVKARVKGITGTVVSVFSYDTDYGRQTKTILEDKTGNVMVAKELGNANYVAERGSIVRFTATIKEHTVYDGVKQTVLLRAANVEFLDESGNVLPDVDEAPAHDRLFEGAALSAIEDAQAERRQDEAMLTRTGYGDRYER